MRISFICVIFLIALAQLALGKGEQTGTIPNVNLKWAIPPVPYVGYPPECRRFLTSTGIYGLISILATVTLSGLMLFNAVSPNSWMTERFKRS